MFFSQAFKGKNEWWRYLAVSLLVFVGYQIGSLPLILALWRTSEADPDLNKSDINSFLSEPNFENFGINPNLGLTLLLLMFIAALVAFYFLFKPFHEREFRTLSTPGSQIKWNKAIFAFFVWLGLSLLLESVSYAFSPQDYSFSFKLNRFIPLLIICILILPIQTSFEELFFRGYLMQGFGLIKLNKIFALILTTLLIIIGHRLLNQNLIATFDELFANKLTELGIAGPTMAILWIGLGFLSFAIFSKIFKM